MQIEICRFATALKSLREGKPKDLILIVNSPLHPSANQEMCVSMLKRNCRDFLQLEFDDVIRPSTAFWAPKRYQVELALKFAQGRDRVVVACQRGKCRSPAIGYAIGAMEHGAAEALKLLRPQEEHYPNRLILEHAAVALRDESILRWVDTYLEGRPPASDLTPAPVVEPMPEPPF